MICTYLIAMVSYSFLSSFSMHYPKGTLWSGSKLIPGALEVIKYLQLSGKLVFLFSNNATRSIKDLISKAKTYGFDFIPDYVLTSGVILEYFLKTFKTNKISRALVLAEPAVVHTVSSAGIEVVSSPGPVW